MIGHVVERRRRKHWKGPRRLISARVPPEMHDEVVRRAKDADMTQSAYLLALVRHVLNGEPKP